MDVGNDLKNKTTNHMVFTGRPHSPGKRRPFASPGPQEVTLTREAMPFAPGRAAARVRTLPVRADGGPEPPPAETPYPRP